MKESLSEYLARGGKITKIPTQEYAAPTTHIPVAAGGPANLLTYSEADLYYGEIKTRKPNNKPVSRIDLNALPKSIRDKYFKELADDQD